LNRHGHLPARKAQTALIRFSIRLDISWICDINTQHAQTQLILKIINKEAT
jgi:hypothetical protein